MRKALKTTALVLAVALPLGAATKAYGDYRAQEARLKTWRDRTDLKLQALDRRLRLIGELQLSITRELGISVGPQVARHLGE